jgi:tRNA modification GTPase
MMNDNDTIIAPATAVGEAGIAVLRISGNQSLSFLTTVFCPLIHVSEFRSHYLYLGKIIDSHNLVIDEVMAVYMEPPRTYTREPIVEIHCHGSRQIVRKLVELANNYGIRLARPGEFTYRAYLNGRIDLVQAEAVARLIQSTSEFSRKSALQQLDGLLSRELHGYALKIRNLLVQIEAWIDFPDEDLPMEDVEQISSVGNDIHEQMLKLLATYRSGQYVHDGAIIALAGLPNAGKSSLMNALLREDRSIVSDLPGTTRDLIEQTTQISGINVRLVDTAGLRKSEDFVEIEGVRRARNMVKNADLIILILDGSSPVCEMFLGLLSEFSTSHMILVVNKSDLAPAQADFGFFSGPVVHLSAKYGYGVGDLIETISSFLLHDYAPDAESPYITEGRHFESLSAAAYHLNRVLENLESAELDLLSIDLRATLDSLGQITGSVTTDDILGDIFSSFCIGK